MKARDAFRFLLDLVRPTAGTRFRQNVVSLARANLLVQVLTLAAAPVLTRLYGPASFGSLALFASILGMLLAFATWRFDFSVPNAASREEASGLIVLGLIFLGITGVLSAGVLWWISLMPAHRVELEILGGLLLLLPVALVGGGIHQLLQSWFVREAELTVVGRAKARQGVADVALKFGCGFVYPTAAGLIVCTVVSAWIGIGLMWRNARLLREAIAQTRALQLKSCWVEYAGEASLSTARSLANAAAAALFPILVVNYFSAVEAGWLALMQRLAVSPTAAITAGVVQSFWAEAGQLIKSDPRALHALYLRTTRRLALLALPVVIVCLFGPFFVGPVFGEADWAPAGAVLAALIPLLVGQLVFSPTSHLIVHRRQGWELAWNVARFFLCWLVFVWCAGQGFSFAATIFWTSGMVLVTYVGLFVTHLVFLDRARRRAG